MLVIMHMLVIVTLKKGDSVKKHDVRRSLQRDLRVQKTCDALIAAMLEMLDAVPFEKITVKGLCERARIRTATFYAHFKDKYDFFAFLVRERRQASVDNVGVTQLEGRAFYLALARCSFEFLEQNRDLIRKVSSNDLLAMIVNTTGDELKDELVQRLHKDKDDGHCLVADPAIAAEMYIGALSRVCHWWLAQRHPSIDEIMPALESFIDRMRG